MAVLVAVAVTAAVVAGCAVAIVTKRVRSQVNEEIGGRPGADPVAEHQRMINATNHRLSEVETRIELMEVAFDAMNAGVIVTDAAGTVLVRNGPASAISPVSHEQTLVNAAATELLATARAGNPVDRDLEVFGPPRRVLHLHAVPVARSDEIVGALAVIDDVTDHHRIDQLRRDFIANLSHELRTPVGAVSLLAEMLLNVEAELNVFAIHLVIRVEGVLQEGIALYPLQSTGDRCHRCRRNQTLCDPFHRQNTI